MSDSDAKTSPDDSFEAVAARWIARRDRGLGESEQADYQKWLRADPRHAAAMSRPEKNWDALDLLAKEFPVQGQELNPDLLAPRQRRMTWIWAPLLAAAAAVAIIYFAREPKTGVKLAQVTSQGEVATPPGIRRVEPERLTLEDGSIVELNAHAKVQVEYTAAERRVRLEQGEAYFVVAKNAERPFVVTTDRVAVRAVGTEFGVALGGDDLSVLVTEGKVRVDGNSGVRDGKPATSDGLATLVAGQQGVLGLAAARSAPDRPEIRVRELTPADMDHALSWRHLQLEFTNTALGEAVAEFNRFNPQKLIVGDAPTAAVRVTGIFRANNVDAFVRLLDFSFGVTAFPEGTGVVLRKTHGR